MPLLSSPAAAGVSGSQGRQSSHTNWSVPPDAPFLPRPDVVTGIVARSRPLSLSQLEPLPTSLWTTISEEIVPTSGASHGPPYVAMDNHRACSCESCPFVRRSQVRQNARAGSDPQRICGPQFVLAVMGTKGLHVHKAPARRRRDRRP